MAVHIRIHPAASVSSSINMMWRPAPMEAMCASKCFTGDASHQELFQDFTTLLLMLLRLHVSTVQQKTALFSFSFGNNQPATSTFPSICLSDGFILVLPSGDDWVCSFYRTSLLRSNILQMQMPPRQTFQPLNR